jgi:hypothetical protein
MSSLLSQAQKNVANQAIDNLHETFAREITVIDEIANVNIQNPDDYNPLSDAKNPEVTYTANQTIIPARIKYIDKADSEAELIFHGQGGSKAVSTALRQDYGIVRIKVDKQYTDLVKNSTKIIVDGKDCQLLMNYNPISLFDINFSVFYLSRQI